MTAQEIIDLKAKISEVVYYPFDHMPIPELAFLCDMEDLEETLKAVALQNNTTIDFLKSFQDQLNHHDPRRSSGLACFPAMKEAAMLWGHSHGDPVKYSAAYESKLRGQVVSESDLVNLSFSKALMMCQQMVCWSFECDKAAISKVVEKMMFLIKSATLPELMGALGNSRDRNSPVGASLAHEILNRRKDFLHCGPDRLFVLDSVKDSLQSFPLDYIWAMLSDPEVSEEFKGKLIEKSWNGKVYLDPIVRQIENFYRLEKLKKDKAESASLKEIDALYRQAHGIYFMEKKTLLRAIALVRSS